MRGTGCAVPAGVGFGNGGGPVCSEGGVADAGVGAGPSGRTSRPPEVSVAVVTPKAAVGTCAGFGASKTVGRAGPVTSKDGARSSNGGCVRRGRFTSGRSGGGRKRPGPASTDRTELEATGGRASFALGRFGTMSGVQR